MCFVCLWFYICEQIVKPVVHIQGCLWSELNKAESTSSDYLLPSCAGDIIWNQSLYGRELSFSIVKIPSNTWLKPTWRYKRTLKLQKMRDAIIFFDMSCYTAASHLGAFLKFPLSDGEFSRQLYNRYPSSFTINMLNLVLRSAAISARFNHNTREKLLHQGVPLGSGGGTTSWLLLLL